MTIKEYRADFKKKEKENKGLWTCLICGKTYAPMWFEEIKIGTLQYVIADGAEKV